MLRPMMLRLLMLRRMLLGLLLRYRSLWLSDHGLFDTALLLMLAPLRSGRRSRLPRSRGQIRRTRRRRIIIRTTIEVSGNGIFEHGYPTLDRRRSAADRSRRRPVLLDLVPQMPRPQFGIIVRRRRRGLLRNALPRPYDFLALVKRASHLLVVVVVPPRFPEPAANCRWRRRRSGWTIRSIVLRISRGRLWFAPSFFRRFGPMLAMRIGDDDRGEGCWRCYYCCRWMTTEGRCASWTWC